jgi:hypothetical protein
MEENKRIPPLPKMVTSGEAVNCATTQEIRSIL